MEPVKVSTYELNFVDLERQSLCIQKKYNQGKRRGIYTKRIIPESPSRDNGDFSWGPMDNWIAFMAQTWFSKASEFSVDVGRNPRIRQPTGAQGIHVYVSRLGGE